MKAFLIRVNGKRLCLAGVGPSGVLTAIVNWVGGGPRRSTEGRFGFNVGGLDSRTGEHLRYSTPQLQIGDKVSVEIVESEKVDPEAKRYVPELAGDGGPQPKTAVRRKRRVGKTPLVGRNSNKKKPARRT